MAGKVFFSVTMSLDGFIAPGSLGDLMGHDRRNHQRPEADRDEGQTDVDARNRESRRTRRLRYLTGGESASAMNAAIRSHAIGLRNRYAT
jgi:hypothetical protein